MTDTPLRYRIALRVARFVWRHWIVVDKPPRRYLSRRDDSKPPRLPSPNPRVTRPSR